MIDNFTLIISQTVKISIITTTFNSSETIRDTIESVLKQTHKDIEYIIKDAGSDDGTLEICREYELRFNGRMKIVSCKDKGIYDGMNQGIQSSTGDIIGILNSDDFFHRNNILEIISKTFNENEGLDAIYGDSVVVAKDNLKKIVRYTSAKRFKPWMFKIGLMPGHQTFYIRRDTYLRLGLYNENFKIAADFDLLTRYMLVNKIKTKYIPLSILTYRDGGISATLKNKRLLNQEVIKSWRLNGLNMPSWFVYLKYPFRISEYLFLSRRE